MTVLSKSVPTLRTVLFSKVIFSRNSAVPDIRCEIRDFSLLSSTPPEAWLNVMLTMSWCHNHPQISDSFLPCILLSLLSCHLKSLRLTLFGDFPLQKLPCNFLLQFSTKLTSVFWSKFWHLLITDTVNRTVGLPIYLQINICGSLRKKLMKSNYFSAAYFEGLSSALRKCSCFVFSSDSSLSIPHKPLWFLETNNLETIQSDPINSLQACSIS